jgi:hypothetical protein
MNHEAEEGKILGKIANRSIGPGKNPEGPQRGFLGWDRTSTLLNTGSHAPHNGYNHQLRPLQPCCGFGKGVFGA